ncbi:MAG: site-2 protease family protein [Clostridiales bacterium]|nr:site-2 protease family protein [Clostridiales bacterium]
MGTAFYVIAAIFLLGVMVTVHEFGHFIAARMTGIPVKEFAVGFGPKLCSWKSKKHETLFFLRLIPAGGYCAFYGEDDAEGKEKNDPRNLNNYSVWKRMLTIALGPVMNFVLALLAATCLFCYIGEDVGGQYGYAVIQAVTENSPAAHAGIQAGDMIESINGQDAAGIADGEQFKVQQLIGSYREGDAPLKIVLSRNEEKTTVYLSPLYDETEKRMLIGVNLAFQYYPDYQPISIFRGIHLGADYCVRAGGTILSGLKALITTGDGFEDSAGPVGIVQMIAEETQKNGWEVYVQLLVLISVNLGLFNLIPIPGLDGSRILFLAIEAVRRKRVPQKIEAYVHLSGYVLLLGLMLVMTWKDILNIFR